MNFHDEPVPGHPLPILVDDPQLTHVIADAIGFRYQLRALSESYPRPQKSMT